MNAWLTLGIAIVAEVIGTTALKASEGFTRLGPSAIVVAGYAVAFYCLSLVLRTIPVGVTYAIWSGLGIVLITLVAYVVYGQKIDLAEKVRAQVMPCWNPPPADGLASTSVRLRFRLDRDGRVVGQPVRSGVTGQNQVSTAYINLLTNSGRRAVLMCSPLRLPPELYEAWADVEVEFDPRDLR